MRGYGIGEGDVLVLSIRGFGFICNIPVCVTSLLSGLVTELLFDRYRVPPARDPTSLLARHKIGLFRSCRDLLISMPSHRSSAFNRLIVPQCHSIVEAIGHRMAYEAAFEAGINKPTISLYEAGASTIWRGMLRTGLSPGNSQ